MQGIHIGHMWTKGTHPTRDTVSEITASIRWIFSSQPFIRSQQMADFHLQPVVKVFPVMKASYNAFGPSQVAGRA